jgi:hypothetical protein
MPIREYRESDHESVIELSLRAWEPVFASVNAVLGEVLARRVHGEDWREHQARQVSEVLRASSRHVWVAGEHHQISGFGAASITMLTA